MASELKPCPFCGSEHLDPRFWKNNTGESGPGCDECGATAESAEKWNARAADPSAELLRECAKAFEAIAVDPPASETPTIESILNRAQAKARSALARLAEAGVTI